MISNIRLQNFRSYRDQSFEFEDGVNIIVGPNASGKTNLLEAILMMCRGKSFRVKDAETIMFGKPWARIDAYNNEQNQAILIDNKGVKANKQFIESGKKYSKIPNDRKFPVVVFEPNNLRLFHGSPEGRREYFDDIIEQQYPGFSTKRRSYARALAQRNRLLKNAKNTQGQMFVWDLRLSEIGEEIVKARIGLASEINKQIDKIYNGISGTKDKLEIKYSSDCDTGQYGSSMLRRLEQKHEDDRLRGFTSSGPHRDDFVVTINDKPMSSSASRGETRTLVLALKIFELDALEELTNKKPLLLLDDVFSELDNARRTALTEYLNKTQSFITTTDADILAHKLVKLANVIAI